MIDNFDDEQIWQQLELQNEPVLQFFENAVSDTIEGGDISLLPENEEQECEEDGSEMEADGQEDLERDEEEEVSGPSGDDAKGDETAKHPSKSGLRKSPVFSDEDSDLDFDISKLEQQSKVQNKVPRKPREKSVVDDKFFKLSEMEAFLENMEKEEEQRDDSEEEEVDFFEDVSSDEDEGGLFGSEKLKVKFWERRERALLIFLKLILFCFSRRSFKCLKTHQGISEIFKSVEKNQLEKLKQCVIFLS